MAPAYISRLKVASSLAAVTVVSVGLLTSCSSSGSKAPGGGSSSGGTAATGNTVQVKNFSFEPTNLSVSKGTKVTWKFEDGVAHNVDSTTNAFPKSKDLSSGGTYSFTFNTAGTYKYFCSIHQYMKGSVTVK